ncbi:MAG: hypothetical protein EAZ16_06485 [Sphingobacteriales bacterium]|jgi:hypothetical protein|nr:MAG: hypothetical protein EAZ16_06485 [Sphingobacteriales bacterium]
MFTIIQHQGAGNILVESKTHEGALFSLYLKNGCCFAKKNIQQGMNFITVLPCGSYKFSVTLYNQIAQEGEIVVQ